MRIPKLTKRGDGRWQAKYQGKTLYFRGSNQEALAALEAMLGLTPEPHSLVVLRRVSELKPAPENDIYDPVTAESVAGLTAEIARDGVLEPIVITEDDYILSGHRRRAAAIQAGIEKVPVRVFPIRREDNHDRFASLLVSYNRQRIKTFAEKMHEEAVRLDPAQAYQCLLAERAERSVVKLQPMRLGARRARSKISEAKMPMLQACQAILKRYRVPISDRKIHYELLNNPPLKNATDPNSRYRNDRRSYSNLTDLLTRARIEGLIGWGEISDATRPITVWQAWPDTQPFIETELSSFLGGYQRDLMQSQPNHIEILVEKNTVLQEIESVAAKYGIPLTSGRGFCSSLPRHEMAERFSNSGRSKLILLIISDLDPAGMSIKESFAQSLRDDFGVRNVYAIDVAITYDHVGRFKLPHGERAKAGRGENDGLRAQFVQRYGEYVYEVEALPQGALPRLLDEAIRGVLDLEAYNHEVEQEKIDAAHIMATRSAARSMLKELHADENDSDEEIGQ